MSLGLAEGFITKIKRFFKIPGGKGGVVPCPYHAAWSSPGHGGRTAKEHGEWFVPTTRTWSNSTYGNGLDATRSAEEKADIVDELFSRYAALVAKDPADHGMDYVHCYAVIERA